MKCKSKGFTLIELLVVIAIIALLASVVLASLETARKKSRDSRRIADIKQIQLALSLYYNDNGVFPKDIYAASGSLAPNYISVIPKDPTSNGNYTYTALAGANTADTSLCGSYHLGVSLEDIGNGNLLNDFDATVGGTFGTGSSDGTVCQGSANSSDFSGISSAAGGSLCSTTAGTPQPGGTESCFDVRP